MSDLFEINLSNRYDMKAPWCVCKPKWCVSQKVPQLKVDTAARTVDIAESNDRIGKPDSGYILFELAALTRNVICSSLQ